MDLNKIKRAGLITGVVLLSLYVIFLLLPVVLSPILNSYTPQIESMIEDASGFKVKLERLGIVTTPKLTAGIKINHAEFSLPDGEEFLSADNFRAKLSLLPLLIGRIEADAISVESVEATLKVRQDGKFLMEEYMPQPDPDAAPQTMQPLPLGFKLSNKLPDVVIDDYILTFVDMASKSEYTLSGQNMKLSDFILDKKFKFSAKGNLSLNNTEQFKYDVKLFNKLMPDISLNDLVFNPQPEEEKKAEENFVFNFMDIFKALSKTGLTANLNTDLKTSGTFDDPEITGSAAISNLSMLVDGKKLPESSVIFLAKGKNAKLDMNLFSANDEKTVLNGKFRLGKNPAADMKFTSNAQFNNLFKILNSIAQSFNYNDLRTLSATGGIDADFTVKADKKHVKSSGFFKIPNASVNYRLYNVALKNIKADIDFNNMVNIKDAGLEVMGHPLKIYGTIQNNAVTDLHIKADNILLKGLAAAAGQVQLLKENKFNSGALSLDASLTGKLSKIVPAVNLSVNNLDIKNIPSNTRVTMPEAKFVIDTDGKNFTGDLTANELKVSNPLAVVSLPEAEVIIGQKDIDIKKAYLLFNNSRIDVTGKIANYINDKMKIDINASGSLLANDIKSLFPKEFMINASGKIPVKVSITGGVKDQNIKFSASADPQNYAAILDINELKGKTTIINSNIKITDDTAKLSETGIFAGNNPILTVDGTVNNLSKSQKLNLRVSVPKKVKMAIPGFKNSSLSARGDIDVTGTAAAPYLKGLVSVADISIPDMALTMTNLVANLNGPVLKGNATLQNFKSGGIVADNIATSFLLKNYSVFYLNNLVADAFDGKISGNISYGINDGKITVKMSGSDMNAVKTIEGAAGIKNALSGTLAFDADIATKGTSDVDMMKNLTGSASFSINNGKFLNVGRFDTLLYAQNILGNAILKAAVTSVTSLPIIQNTAEFKNINGNLKFKNGWADIEPITTTGPLMAYYIIGRYNLLNGTTNVVVLGRLDEKVVTVLGPLGDLSVDKLTSYIPKFGVLTAVLIDSMTTDPEKENTANIPALSTGSTSYKDFKVEFNGGLDSTSSVKSFKWLSHCDTSAIDVNSDFENAKEAIKNTVEDTKQQLLDAKEGLKNLFKF